MVLCLEVLLHQGYTRVASAVMFLVNGISTDAFTNVSMSYSMFVFKKRHGRLGDAFPSGVSGNDSGLVADSAGMSTRVDGVPESPLEMESISGWELVISESLSSPAR